MFAPRTKGIKRIGQMTNLAVMTVVVLMVFAFGANGLNTDPIWTDELYSISNMGGWNPPSSPAGIVSSVADNFPDHVPLFFLLGAGWANFVGWTQFALRLMPVLAGALMIAWIYRLASDMYNRFVGTVSAILLGSSAYMILYIHDFRMYSLFLMFATVHMWIYWRLIQRKTMGRLAFVVLIGSALTLLYTHIFSFIFFAGLGIYQLLFVEKSRQWFRLMAGWCVAAVLFLPYLHVVIAGLRRASEKSNVTSRAASVQELLSTFLYLFGNGSWLVIAIVIGVLAFVLAKRRQTALLGIAIVPLTMMVAIISLNEVVRIIPLTRMRYFLIVWIPLVIVVACALSLLPHRRVLTMVVILLWGVAGFQYYRSDDIILHTGSMVQTRLYPPMQDYVYQLEGKVRPHDYLLGFTRYDHVNKVLTLGKSVADYYMQLHLGIDGAFIRQGAYGDWLARDIRDKLDSQPFLLFTYNPQDLAGSYDKVMSAIQAGYVACNVLLDRSNLHIQRFVLEMLDCDREYAPIEYVNGVTLVDRFARYLPEDNVVQTVTGWEVANEQLLQEYNISLQIITPEWQMKKQEDRHLYNNILKWYRSDLSTAGLPPGDYRVMVIVYDRETIKKVAGTDLVSGRTGDIFPILAFTIEA